MICPNCKSEVPLGEDAKFSVGPSYIKFLGYCGGCDRLVETKAYTFGFMMNQFGSEEFFGWEGVRDHLLRMVAGETSST